MKVTHISKEVFKLKHRDPSFIGDHKLKKGIYIYSYHPEELNLCNTLSNFIFVEESILLSTSARSNLFGYESKSDKLVLLGPNDICTVRTYNHLREKLLGITKLRTKETIVKAIKLIEDCESFTNNQLLLFILMCLYQQIREKDKVKNLLEIYISKGFDLYKKQILLLLSQLNTFNERFVINALHKKRPDGAIESSAKLLQLRKIRPSISFDSFIKNNINIDLSNLIIIAHGHKNDKDGDIIEVERKIAIKDLLSQLKQNRITCRNFILISCWTNYIDFDPQTYGVNQIIFHGDFIRESTVYQFTLHALDALSSFSSEGEIFDYIKLSMYLYTIQTSDLSRA